MTVCKTVGDQLLQLQMMEGRKVMFYDMATPKYTLQVKVVGKECVPVKTDEKNACTGAIWRDWARYQKSIPPTLQKQSCFRTYSDSGNLMCI